LLGAAYFNLGRYGDAAEQFLAGLWVDPENPGWLPSLSRAYEKMGIDPNPVLIHGNTFTLNRNAPPVRDELARVAPMLNTLFQQAGKSEEADALRKKFD